jgi:hypothetical protein
MHLSEEASHAKKNEDGTKSHFDVMGGGRADLASENIAHGVMSMNPGASMRRPGSRHQQIPAQMCLILGDKNLKTLGL